jgi:ABC-type sugar transport system ATPase subunit
VVEDCKSGMFINRKKRKENAEESVKKLEIKTSSIEQAIMNLSGGNQQKVILSRWLLANPEILLVDEPTHGIDVGAKAEIYKIIDKLTNEGISILLVSSELPELILLCDRIAIMYHGKMVGILNREEFSQERIMSYATGQLQNVENISLSIP